MEVMPIQIGQKRESGFDNPLGLLSDCHRRIESFLVVLKRVASEFQGRELSADERTSLEKALKYFRESAPKHTSDEEDSLFPRLRSSAHPLAKASLDSLDALEADHVAAAADHDLVDSLGRRWLESSVLPEAEHQKLSLALDRLSRMYARHIALEDTELFPLAARVLPAEELASIGREMAERRDVKR